MFSIRFGLSTNLRRCSLRSALRDLGTSPPSHGLVLDALTLVQRRVLRGDLGTRACKHPNRFGVAREPPDRPAPETGTRRTPARPLSFTTPAPEESLHATRIDSAAVPARRLANLGRCRPVLGRCRATWSCKPCPSVVETRSGQALLGQVTCKFLHAWDTPKSSHGSSRSLSSRRSGSSSLSCVRLR